MINDSERTKRYIWWGGTREKAFYVVPAYRLFRILIKNFLPIYCSPFGFLSRVHGTLKMSTKRILLYAMLLGAEMVNRVIIQTVFHFFPHILGSPRRKIFKNSRMTQHFQSYVESKLYFNRAINFNIRKGD